MPYKRLLFTCRGNIMSVKFFILTVLISGIFLLVFNIQMFHDKIKIKSDFSGFPKEEEHDSLQNWIENVFEIERNSSNINYNYETNNVFKDRRSTDIDCIKVLNKDKSEIEKAKASVNPYSQPDYRALLLTGCDHFKTERGYITSSLTLEEENFSIAYSIIVFKDVPQVERLLRAIYRPQNYYCIHIDIKSNDSFREIIENITSCFDNVFISSRSVSPVWGQFSILVPDLICMEDLLKYKKWKYFINLTGQEFPLRTNYELVKILRIYNGANDVEGTIKRANKERWEKKLPAPHGITPTKGSLHITANRAFVDYVLHNETAKKFLNWTKSTSVPDETFFSSLNHNPHLNIPGSYKGEPETDSVIKPFLTRFVNWGIFPFNWTCHGQRVRLVCVFGVEDIPLLMGRPEFFTNKFYLDYQPVALDCMEEFHYNRTRDQYEQKLSFNTKYYENLPFIKDVVK